MSTKGVTSARAYLLKKLEELEHERMERMQEFKRVEAQRNELNAQGTHPLKISEGPKRRDCSPFRASWSGRRGSKGHGKGQGPSQGKISS